MALGQKGIQTPLQLAKLMVTILQGREVKLNILPGTERFGPPSSVPLLGHNYDP